MTRRRRCCCCWRWPPPRGLAPLWRPRRRRLSAGSRPAQPQQQQQASVAIKSLSSPRTPKWQEMRDRFVSGGAPRRPREASWWDPWRGKLGSLSLVASPLRRPLPASTEQKSLVRAGTKAGRGRKKADSASCCFSRRRLVWVLLLDFSVNWAFWPPPKWPSFISPFILEGGRVLSEFANIRVLI
jgi:hypothetical protein